MILRYDMGLRLFAPREEGWVRGKAALCEHCRPKELWSCLLGRMFFVWAG